MWKRKKNDEAEQMTMEPVQELDAVEEEKNAKSASKSSARISAAFMTTKKSGLILRPILLPSMLT